jgi:3-oxoacyl-[acyl-carrier protein] reductase
MSDSESSERTAHDRETILVLGASSDIGVAILERLAPSGPRVLAHHSGSVDKIERLRGTLGTTEVVPLRADLSRASELDALVAAIREHPLPDKIVHLAAPKLEYRRFNEIAWEDVQREIDVQLRSLVVVGRALLPEMAKRRRGKVVCVLSSVTLNVPPAAMVHYVTTKYALLGLVRALASEYARQHLNVNAVSPSMVETSFLSNLPTRMVEIAASQTPRQRNATVADVAAAVCFLLSADADFITGANVPVSGGSAF